MLHLDLFSGIGGASLAADTVWGKENIEHIFCDNEPFAQQVLKKHWPEARIYGDIRTLTYANCSGFQGKELLRKRGSGIGRGNPTYLLTGGFPCQPFSQAGRRKGTEDDRYLWPEMLRVIREFRPRWVIGENVAGFVTWNDGMVLRQVLADLEGEGYEVQAFVIPAVAKNAPHRRDRVWVVANRSDKGLQGGKWPESHEARNAVSYGTVAERHSISSNAQDPISERSGGRHEDSGQILGVKSSEIKDERPDWSRNWLEVATEFCGVDDGLSAELDGFKLTKSQHRAARLKGLGNAWVPQVAIEIMKAIKTVDEITH